MEQPAGGLSPVVRIARAKINLSLAVIGRRDDGFHDLHSVMASLGLADRLSLAPGGGSTDSLHVDPPPAWASGEDLVLRAIAATRTTVRGSWPGAPAAPFPLAARLDKRVPVAAGLGGGSSDAAAAIDGALAIWGADPGTGERLALAASVGSDVPFCISGGLAAVEGRGERVTQLAPLGGSQPGVLLVIPDVAVATAAVFAAFAGGAVPADHGDATRAASHHLVEEMATGMDGRKLLARAGILATANDLLIAAEAVIPGLTRFRRDLSRLLHRPVGQSGSGPALWALYPSEDDATAAADAVRAALVAADLSAPGNGPPTIVATRLETGVTQ
jgi:4-diphosphocytidyl-2-C-methyl-D-erythritol kinase